MLPDPTDTATLTEAQLVNFIPSQIDLAGRVIAMEGNASIHAPGAAVNMYATLNPYQLAGDPSKPIADGGSIYIDSSSQINVAGLSNVALPATADLVQVTLETNDLQNDPQLRSGFLHGATVTVNVNAPPSLFDVTPYADNIGSNISRIMTAGGAIFMDATGDVITRAGSSLNVSGGSLAYQGGYGPSTTNLIGANGVVYNIANAPADLQYVGIANSYAYTDPTWGVTTRGGSQSYYAPYTQGESAGSIQVEAPQVYLRGGMLGTTVDGIYQRTPATMAQGGTLIVGCSSCQSQNNVANYGVDGGVSFANNLSDTLVGNVVVDGDIVSSVNIPP